jgi:predicted small secreted protein
MKKMSLMIILLVICTIVSGCAEEKPQLSELQITACNTADDAGTCDTKLPELEIVTTGQCCNVLGKCC